MSTASDITRRAKSNLAFALRLLPAQRRADAVLFYAFCRTIDDLADSPGLSLAQRQSELNAWKIGLQSGFENATELQREIVALRDRHQLPTELLTAIIDGCLMDLQPQRFADWDELCRYIWHVAGAVGLVSIRLFGCTDPASERYAVTLGQALQLTNILRDIDEDLSNGARIYLPLAELARVGLTEQDLQGRTHDSRFNALMTAMADRAQRLFRDAAACLPTADRKALLPARVMANVYQAILRNMQADGFRVFEKRYRISTFRKLLILSKHLIA